MHHRCVAICAKKQSGNCLHVLLEMMGAECKLLVHR
jgi:hypothetical protein